MFLARSADSERTSAAGAPTRRRQVPTRPGRMSSTSRERMGWSSTSARSRPAPATGPAPLQRHDEGIVVRRTACSTIARRSHVLYRPSIGQQGGGSGCGQGCDDRDGDRRHSAPTWAGARLMDPLQILSGLGSGVSSASAEAD